eukprot:CAMPEP_0194776582 /NCGR_PEP_ID=MMETSP0323_2-20130528/63501_1 /TAXON_ID=2866 ORGANISM="Crypthecodinium cohnii, Strain Seligo" /NCGR_SAMPLE_ID=MMETSP0323_2 /ASSEMBLY_ACC=CAM_ASM_000346 /LENGTH=201 /DNA_ID=CAMNT_0039713047 /DNA_START=16 /DNA_END=620 /DNA_ORIENTATION=+
MTQLSVGHTAEKPLLRFAHFCLPPGLPTLTRSPEQLPACLRSHLPTARTVRRRCKVRLFFEGFELSELFFEDASPRLMASLPFKLRASTFELSETSTLQLNPNYLFKKQSKSSSSSSIYEVKFLTSSSTSLSIQEEEVVAVIAFTSTQPIVKLIVQEEEEVEVEVAVFADGLLKGLIAMSKYRRDEPSPGGGGYPLDRSLL